MQERYHNSMTKEEFAEFVLQHRLTWEQLQKIVRRANHATEDLFDADVSKERGMTPGFDKSDWDRANESMQRALRKLHLLKIPLHYDKYGQVYIVRQECGEFLFDEHKEQLLNQLNEAYSKYEKARNNSKNKEQLEKEYASAMNRANAYMLNEFWYHNQKNRFEFIKDDDARWLDSI